MLDGNAVAEREHDFRVTQRDAVKLIAEAKRVNLVHEFIFAGGEQVRDLFMDCMADNAIMVDWAIRGNTTSLYSKFFDFVDRRKGDELVEREAQRMEDERE